MNMRRRPMLPTVGLWGLALSTTFAPGCASQGSPERSSSEPLPQSIHGLPLVESHAGEEAAAIVGRLHRSDPPPGATYIGIYGPEDMRTMLYVTRFAAEDGALSQLGAMAARLTEGSRGFGHYRRFAIRDHEVHAVFGLGRVHYFYSDGNDVKWLGVPPQLARPALAELLNVPVSEIPQISAAPAGVDSVPQTEAKSPVSQQ